MRNLPLFGGLNMTACAALAQAAQRIEVPDGDAIYQSGERADSLFILYAGSVRLEREELILHELGEGAHLGDMEFFDMAPRSFTARAQGPCEVWELSFEVLDHLRRKDLKAFALIAMNAAREMSRRLRSLDQERHELNQRIRRLEQLN